MINPISKTGFKTLSVKLALNILMLIAVLYPIAIIIGYSDLANTILVNFIQFVIVGITLMIIQKSLKHGVSVFTNFLFIGDQDTSHKKLFAYWAMVVFDAILFGVFLISALLVWGVYPQTVYDILDLIFLSGFKIGGSAFSVMHIAKAVVVYLAVYYLFKFILVIIEKHAFPYTSLDSGTKNAVRTVIGYIGLIAAVVMSVYSLGLTSTSLAFILSAFTFGISFGLKEIFNNFISGLILLIERPIKVGDWVNVGNESGEVKKIRLRSTTVETFDKKTLLIPNSEFITSTVSNDLYNPVSRSVIEIECGYEDDPVIVQELLVNLAKNHEGVLSNPEPSAIFTGFNASGLGFQLRFYCKTKDKVVITSKIRFTIIKVFRENNIEIPYPKQDLYIKEMPAK